MSNILAIMRRELASYFTSPLAYLFIVIFLVAYLFIVIFLFPKNENEDIYPILKQHALAQAWPVHDLRPETGRLEDVFRKLTKVSCNILPSCAVSWQAISLRRWLICSVIPLPEK